MVAVSSTSSCGVQGDVQSRDQHIYGCDTGDGTNSFCQKSCCLTRVLPTFLASCRATLVAHVAVFAGLGGAPLGRRAVQRPPRGQLAGGNGFFKGKRNGFGEFFRSHNKLF